MPDLGVQGGANHPEAQRVGRTWRCSKGYRSKYSGSPIDFLLDNQCGTVDIRLVPIIAIRPTQHSSQIGVIVVTHRTSEHHFRIRGHWAQDGTVRGSAMGHLPGIIDNREDA